MFEQTNPERISFTENTVDGKSRKRLMFSIFHSCAHEAKMITTSREFGSVSIVIPVVNEVDNVKRLVEEIGSLPKSDLTSSIKEIVFVDDGSTDGTQEAISDISNALEGISIILRQRNERHGTVNAQLFGMANASHNVVIVMDGDLQHPVRYLPELIRKYREGYDLVIASRYISGGSTERTIFHGVVSRSANAAAKIMLPSARRVKDPISGFFMIDKRIINQAIEPNGHNKLALYILAGTRRVTVADIP